MKYFDFDIQDEPMDELKSVAKAGAPTKYPFNILNVGQSFKIKDDVSIQSLRCLAYQHGVSKGKKFTVSKKLMKVIRTA